MLESVYGAALLIAGAAFQIAAYRLLRLCLETDIASPGSETTDLGLMHTQMRFGVGAAATSISGAIFIGFGSLIFLQEK